MTEEWKCYFEIINTFWNLLTPHVNSEDEKAYKRIMTDNFNMLVKDRGGKFTDEWYRSTQELVVYPEKYKNTKYAEFAAEFDQLVDCINTSDSTSICRIILSYERNSIYLLRSSIANLHIIKHQACYY